MTKIQLSSEFLYGVISRRFKVMFAQKPNTWHGRYVYMYVRVWVHACTCRWVGEIFHPYYYSPASRPYNTALTLSSAAHVIVSCMCTVFAILK